MVARLVSLRDLLTRAVRSADSLAASGSIANARVAARETSLQLAFRETVPRLPEDVRELARQLG
jgi:hypothetical protein